MANIRQYIGPRYVLKIYENSQDPLSPEWEANTYFEPLTMVTFQNSSYVSRKDVPPTVGDPASNPAYWAITGAYNGQIANLQNQINTNRDNIDELIASKVYNGAGDYDLDNTGVEDCAAKLESVTDNIGLKAGVYKIASDCTINAQVVMANGARFDIDSGVTLTINGQILAGRYRIFSGAGDVVVNEDYQDFGYPEWFNSDIAATYKTFRHILLAPKVYTLSSTLLLDKSNTCIEGISYPTNQNADVALLIFTSGRLAIGAISGTDINEFPRNITVKNLQLGIESAGSCIDIYGVVRPMLENIYIYTKTAAYGINYIRSIGGIFHNIYVQSVAITGTFIGYRFHDDSGTGIAGARSASNWLINCTYADTARDGGNTFGFLISAGNSDIFIIDCEVAIANIGLSISGLNSEKSVNIRISGCDFDSCATKSIEIYNCTKGMITFNNCYCANAADATGVITFQSTGSSATVIVEGMQIILTKDNTIGFLCDAISSMIIHGLGINNGDGVTGTTAIATNSATNVIGDYIFDGVVATI